MKGLAWLGCLLLTGTLALAKGPSDQTMSAEELEDGIKVIPHFVLFFAPWSGHYEKLAPIWNELADLYNVRLVPKVRLAKVNCDEEKELCEKHGFSFIGIKYFPDHRSEGIEFTELRTKENIQKFLRNQIKGIRLREDSVQVLDDDDFVGDAMAGHYFIKFYAPWCGHCKALNPVWNTLAERFDTRGVNIAQVDCTEVPEPCGRFQVAGYPTLLWFYNGQQVEKFEGPRNIEKLTEFTEKTMAKTNFKKAQEKNNVVSLTSKTFTQKLQGKLAVIMFHSPSCGFCKQLKPTWSQLADEFQNKKSVVIGEVDCSGSEKDFCGRQHDAWGFPTIRCYGNGGFLVDFMEARSFENLVKFVEDALEKYPNFDGKLSARQDDDEDEDEDEDDDEEEEEEEEDEFVKTLTVDDFDGYALTDHYFVKFYAPWCGHCKAMANTWYELGEKYATDFSVNIAEVDCTQYMSACQRYAVTGYPTLLWFYNTKQVGKFEGARTYNGLEEYIEKMRVTDFTKQKAGKPHDLTEDNFAAKLKGKLAFVMFHSPKCGFCTRMHGPLDELAGMFKKYKKVRIAKIDCLDHKDFCGQKHGAWGFPTIKLYKNGHELEEYRGEGRTRDVEGFSKFINEFLEKYPLYAKLKTVAKDEL